MLTAANQWMSVILFIPGALRNVALTHLSASNNDKIRNKSILQRLFVVNFVSTFIPFLIILFLSGWLTVLYGDSFDGIRPVLNVCVFTAVISSLSNVLTQEFMAYSQNWFLFISRLIRDIGILTSIYVALLYFDHGALISAVVGLIWQLFYLGILLVFSRTRNRVI
jgi:O-antigen/teichoic acid export membrane protein